MTKIFGHYVPIEMFLLWVVELAVCFGLGYALLASGLGLENSSIVETAAVLAASAGLTSFSIGLYHPETFLGLRRLMAKTAVAAVLSFPAMWLIGRLVGIDFGLLLGHGALLPLKMLAAWIGLVVLIRLAFSYSVRMNMFSRRIVILGAGPGGTRTAHAIGRLRDGVFELAGQFEEIDADEEGTGRLMQQLRRRRVWGVVLSGADGEAETVRAEALLRRSGAGVKVWRDHMFWENQLRRVDIDCREGAAHVPAAADAPAPGFSQRLQSAIRRTSDVVLSLALLGFTLPLMLLTALLIKLDSPGPVFYRQERVGLAGRTFVLCKFRSMRTDAEVTGPVWAAKGDSRVTRIGSYLRLARIDELPQLVNVLRGEMSFIGPRPERPHFVEKLAGIIPAYAGRARVKPGLTGWAQVNYPYGASVEDARMKLSYDLYYVKHRNLFLDVLILFATVRVILFQEGAR